MLLRMLLVLVAVAGLSLSGCKKEEPTVGDVLNQAQEKVEDAADEAEDVVEDAQDAAEDMM